MSEIKGIDLIIDTNYILYRSVYSLVAIDSLFGDLENVLETTFKNYLSKYHFNKIYMVSDSKSSWRKRIYPEYKANRKELRDKQVEIDWEFVFKTYDTFKSKLKNNRIVSIEAPNIEGDDWIRYIVNRSNGEGYSTLYVASDKDLNQLLDFRIEPAWMNIQWYDNFKNGKIYLPKGYEILLSELEDDMDLFSTNENSDFKQLLQDLMDKNKVEVIDKEQSLFIKIISGDTGDNIDSVLKTPTLTNPEKFMGIGEAGALKIWNDFKTFYPYEIRFEKDEWLADVLPLILRHKKVDKEKYGETVESNLKLNRSLIHLHENYLPQDIKDSINNVR
jgi:5'-3' exonuclease